MHPAVEEWGPNHGNARSQPIAFLGCLHPQKELHAELSVFPFSTSFKLNSQWAHRMSFFPSI